MSEVADILFRSSPRDQEQATSSLSAASRWLPSWLNERPTFTFDAWRAELGSLSEEERTQALAGRYGIQNHSVVETPELLAESFTQLEEALDEIPEQQKEAYETAVFVNPVDFTKDEFRLAFLRADDFNAVAAAHRLVKYFDRKVALFGVDDAFKPGITIMNMKEEDYPALIKGGLRLLPDYDLHGRALVLNFYPYYDTNVKSMMKLFWFVMHDAIFHQDEDSNIVQKKGFVFFSGNVSGSPQPFHVKEMQHYLAVLCGDMTKVLPMKFVSCYAFLPNSFGMHCAQATLQFLGSYIRTRLVYYKLQNLQENLKELYTCGLPPDRVPAEFGGEAEINYQDWLKERVEEDLFEAGVNYIDNDRWREEVPTLKPLLDMLGC